MDGTDTEGRVEIEMLHPDGSRGMSLVEWGPGDGATVRITYQGIVSEGSSSDFFGALGRARRRFEALGYRLLCYGASKNVWATGMARDMGRGLRAYFFHDDPGIVDIRDIFASGPDVIPATVEEQTAFWTRIYESG